MDNSTSPPGKAASNVLPNQPLPVRPGPRTGESLSSYVQHLTGANGMHWRRAVPELRDVGVPPADLERIAALSGLALLAVRELTLDRYPPSVRGSGPTHRAGWLLSSSSTWRCPGCTHTSRHTQLLWQTALMPLCTSCGVYLTPNPSLAPAVPAAVEVVELSQRLVTLAETSITSDTARRELGRFRRLCASIAQTADTTWPPRPVHLGAVNSVTARQWGAHPCSDPQTVATIMVAAAPALESDRAYDKFAAEAAGRRRGTKGQPSAQYLARRPRGTPRTVILSGFNTADSQRLQWFATGLTRHLDRGLRPDHIPALLPTTIDHNDLPESGQWRARSRAAIALHMIMNTPPDRAAPSSSTTCHAFGTADTENSPLLDGIRLGRGLHQHDAEVLTDGLRTLLRKGLVDYQRRRDTLRAVTHLPQHVNRQLRPWDDEEYPWQWLALGWIWTRFTHGPMWTSRWPDTPDQAIRDFETRIDPESKFVLYDAGKQMLADADLLTIPAAAATSSAYRKRFG